MRILGVADVSRLSNGAEHITGVRHGSVRSLDDVIPRAHALSAVLPVACCGVGLAKEDVSGALSVLVAVWSIALLVVCAARGRGRSSVVGAKIKATTYIAATSGNFLRDQPY